ncbi:MAG: hypothetical protein ACK2T3_16485 [Candidatus Promineifilaceae bacterium]
MTDSITPSQRHQAHGVEERCLICERAATSFRLGIDVWSEIAATWVKPIRGDQRA